MDKIYFRFMLENGELSEMFSATEEEAGEIQFALHEAYEPQQVNMVMDTLNNRLSDQDAKSALVYDEDGLYGFIQWDEMPKMFVRDWERKAFYAEHPELK